MESSVRSGLLNMTLLQTFSAVQVSRMLPSASAMEMVSPAFRLELKVERIEPCVDSLPKFCAIPLLPRAMIVPPVMAAEPL